MSRYVRIYYGPYDNFYNVSHKPQKLRGLKDQLLRLGFRVDLVPVEFRNHCVVKMQGREIFRCNIQNLKFNSPCAVDPVCKRALDAILDASRRFQLADDYFWLRSLLTEEVMSTLEHYPSGPKNYWLSQHHPYPCSCTFEKLSKVFS